MSMRDPFHTQAGLRRAAGLVGMIGLSFGIVGMKAASGPASRAALHPGLPRSSSSPRPTATATVPAPATATPTASPAVTARRTVDGDPYFVRYGTVQVQLVMSGSHIVDVVSLQLPDQTPHDQEIDSYAVPQLRQEVLAVQSAQIDAVSGASYTSEGYAASVQSALDRARA